ncbi:MAG TPA: endonuclease III [Ignavibacteria bacterium]|nr:endonuclease III [Ignavibacteria bacterium]
MKSKETLLKIIDALHKLYGSQGSYPKRDDLLDLLIAAKLTQNTTDKSAYIAFENLKKKYQNWNEALEASHKELADEIRVCGLANTKAKEIQEMLRQMKEKYGNFNLSFLHKMKDDEIYRELLQYRGFGVKIISCLLTFGLNRPSFVVDRHVHRVLNRIGITKANTPDKTFEQANKIIPDKYKVSFHADVIKFGRNICRAQNPLCGICPVYRYCEFELKKFFKEKTFNVPGTENNFIIFEHI